MTCTAPASPRLVLIGIGMMIVEFAGGCQPRAGLSSVNTSPSLGQRMLTGPTWLPDLLLPESVAGRTRVAVPESVTPLAQAISPPVLRSVAASGLAGENADDGHVLPAAWEPATVPRSWRYIVLHHSASEHGDVGQIDAAHRQRTDDAGQPWLGIGYHFVVGNGQGMADGLVEPTFRWRDQLHGAHAGNREYNEQGIGICLVGDFDRVPPTERQLAATQTLLQALTTRFHIDRNDIRCHGELKNTACPGRLFSLDTVLGQIVPKPTASAMPQSVVPQMDLPAQLPAASVR